MKKQTKKLKLSRETLILLESDLQNVLGGEPPPTQDTRTVNFSC